MELAIKEVKIQAKKLNKQLKSGDQVSKNVVLKMKRLHINTTEIKLKDCLNVVSIQLGFQHWRQAHQFFSGSADNKLPTNWGTYLYPDRGDVFINEWFSSYANAKQIVSEHLPSKWLLPYKKQFIVVGQDYIDCFNLNSQLTELWRYIANDMQASYNSKAWDHLTAAILKQRFLSML